MKEGITMRFMYILVLIAALIVPFQAPACIGDQKPEIRPNVKYYPIVGDKTNHWPKEVKTSPGSITSFLVPIGAKIEIYQMEHGTPLSLMDKDGDHFVRTSRLVVPAWVNIDYDAKKYKWEHLYASGDGVSEVRMHAPGGWTKKIKFTMVYPSETEKPVRPPEQLTLDDGQEKSVSVDAYSDIEVTVAGDVSDGWTASSAFVSSFKLIRVLQVEVSSSDTKAVPQVKLFFARTGSPKATTMFVHRGNALFGKTFKFKIVVEPTAAC